MKIVINKCFGGFGLSHEGMMRYAELKGLTLYPEGDDCYMIYWTVPPKDHVARLSSDAFYAMSAEARAEYVRKYSEQTLYNRDIPRNDPALVQVVEELGDKASDRFAELKVVEIPDEVAWEINEYDGLEYVAEVHRTWS